MSKKDLAEIVLIVDRSGSMQKIVSDAIGALNAFLDDQKKMPGEANASVVLFNHEYQMVQDGVKLESVPAFDNTTYVPAGMTALLDAVARTIDTVGERLGNTPEQERPGKVIVGILTDGLENNSKEYNHAQVMERINKQRDQYQWEFIYLGANQDAFKEGSKIGIDLKDIVSFVATPDGVRTAYKELGVRTTQYRAK